MSAGAAGARALAVSSRLPRGLVYLAIVALFGVAYGTLVYVVSNRWGAEAVAGSAYTFAAGVLLSLMIGIPLHGWVQGRLAALLGGGRAGARLTLRITKRMRYGSRAASADTAGRHMSGGRHRRRGRCVPYSARCFTAR